MAAPALVEKAKTRIGTVLRDKWKLDSLLGVGGSAAVYAATHRNGKRGAIKLLHPELSKQEELVARFLREGYVANKIDHPGSVIILDDDITDDGMAFLVMELLEGYTLERRLRKRSALPVREALKMTEDLLDVLQSAHDKGVIHRDIKPANIFITKDKVLKVLDFGIARLGAQSDQPIGDTQMGQALGTPAFMPPEQARGRWDDVDVRTDLWSVGATLWALLSGQRPRRAETSNEELLLAMTRPLPPIQSVAVHVSNEVAKIVDRSVAFDMGARWPNARTMQQAVRLALLLEQASATAETPEQGAGPSLYEISINASASVQTDFDGTDDIDGKKSPSGAPKSTYDGPLSLSRTDALGPRILRSKSAVPAPLASWVPPSSGRISSITPSLSGSVAPASFTPTGDARLLTTSQPIVVPVAAHPLAPPPLPPRKQRAWLKAVGSILIVAVVAAATHQIVSRGLVTLGGRGAVDTLPSPTAATPAPTTASTATTTTAPTTTTTSSGATTTTSTTSNAPTRSPAPAASSSNRAVDASATAPPAHADGAP